VGKIRLARRALELGGGGDGALRSFVDLTPASYGNHMLETMSR
jgi:hypothetical protein